MFKWAALLGVIGAIVGAGVIVAVAVSNHGSATATSRSTSTGGVPPTAVVSQGSRTIPQGVFDADEEAFVKGCLKSDYGFRVVSGCDCMYHSFRTQGIPASTLAVTPLGQAPVVGPDLGRAVIACSG